MAVKLCRERDSIVAAGNFHPELSMFVFKICDTCPIVAKTSISAMDMNV